MACDTTIIRTMLLEWEPDRWDIDGCPTYYTADHPLHNSQPDDHIQLFVRRCMSPRPMQDRWCRSDSGGSLRQDLYSNEQDAMVAVEAELARQLLCAGLRSPDSAEGKLLNRVNAAAADVRTAEQAVETMRVILGMFDKWLAEHLRLTAEGHKVLRDAMCELCNQKGGA